MRRLERGMPRNMAGSPGAHCPGRLLHSLQRSSHGGSTLTTSLGGVLLPHSANEKTKPQVALLSGVLPPSLQPFLRLRATEMCSQGVMPHHHVLLSSLLLPISDFIGSQHTHWPHASLHGQNRHLPIQGPGVLMDRSREHGRLREGSRSADHERGVHRVLTVMVKIREYFLPV